MDARRPMDALKESCLEFLPKALDAIFDAYANSYRDVNARFPMIDSAKHSKHFDSPEAWWNHPYDRRSYVERYLRSAAKRHGLFTKTEYCNNGSCPHTIIASGEFFLTAHFVKSSSEIVRPAEYRGDYFRDSQQKLAFLCNEDGEDSELLTPTLDDPAYVFIIHGESDDPRFPSFVDVVAPINNCTQYHPQRLKLFSMYPGVVAHRVTGRAGFGEQIPDRPIELKHKPKEA